MSFALVSVDFLFPVRAALAGCGKAINRGTPLSMHGQGSPASRAIPAPYFFTPARRRTREIVYSYLLLYLLFSYIFLRERRRGPRTLRQVEIASLSTQGLKSSGSPPANTSP
jgi:hypothetical protein